MLKILLSLVPETGIEYYLPVSSKKSILVLKL